MIHYTYEYFHHKLSHLFVLWRHLFRSRYFFLMLRPRGLFEIALSSQDLLSLLMKLRQDYGLAFHMIDLLIVS